MQHTRNCLGRRSVADEAKKTEQLNGEPLGTAKRRKTLRQDIHHTSLGDGRNHRLGKLLQPPAFAFNSELRQYNEI